MSEALEAIATKYRAAPGLVGARHASETLRRVRGLTLQFAAQIGEARAKKPISPP